MSRRKTLLAPSHSNLDQLIHRTEIVPISGVDYRCPATWTQPPRQLNDSMWYWIQEGSGQCWIGSPNDVFHFRKGDLLMIPEGVSHEAGPDPGVCVRTTTVHFLAKLSGTIDLLSLLGISGRFPSAVRSPYATSSQCASREYAIKAPGWRWAMSAAITQTLIYIIRHCIDRIELPDSELHQNYLRLRPAIDVVQNRLDDPYLTVADLAEAVFVSEVYLRRLFRATFQQSPVDFITQQRIERAKLLLKTTDVPIKAISEQCGFRDVHFFYRIFRKRTGLSPRTCRTSDPTE